MIMYAIALNIASTLKPTTNGSRKMRFFVKSGRARTTHKLMRSNVLEMTSVVTPMTVEYLVARIFFHAFDLKLFFVLEI